MPKKLRAALALFVVGALSLTTSHLGLATAKSSDGFLKDDIVLKKTNHQVNCHKCCCGTKMKNCARGCKNAQYGMSDFVKAEQECEKAAPKEKAKAKEYTKNVCAPLSAAGMQFTESCTPACGMKAAIKANGLQLLDDQDE